MTLRSSAARRLGLVALVIGLAACAGILGLRKPSEGRFPHRIHVLQGIACTQCHGGIDRAGDEGALHLPGDPTCLGCHTQPHEPRGCVGCHADPFTPAELMGARKHLRFSHAQHLPTVSGNCARCHIGVARQEERLRPPMAACTSCHAHDEQLADRDCDGCHVDLPAEMIKPQSHLVHEGDFLRAHGVRAASAGDLCASCHSETFCATCHGTTTATLPSRLAFHDRSTADMHRAGFLARHAIAARADPGTCSSCHSPSSCQDCHRQQAVAAGASPVDPHPPGWVGIGTQNLHGRAARRDPASCASCHGGAGEMLCVSCHKVGGVGGNPHPPGWSSTRDLGDLPCRLCHVSAR